MSGTGNAQETCGLQQAKFGTDVFEDRFEAFGPGLEAVEPGENRSGGLGSNRPIAATRFGEIANGTFSVSDASLILVNLDEDVISGYPDQS